MAKIIKYTKRTVPFVYYMLLLLKKIGVSEFSIRQPRTAECLAEVGLLLVVWLQLYSVRN